MLTLHAVAGSSDSDAGDAAGDGLAVLVEGERIADLGTAARLRAEYPAARVREWPAGARLSAGRLWTGPLPDAPSPRERVYAALREGATALLGADLSPAAELRAAARRSGVPVLDGPREPRLAVGERADLTVLDGGGGCLATVVAGKLVHRRR
jgi:predicted amidohydrolase YtcJ